MTSLTQTSLTQAPLTRIRRVQTTRARTVRAKPVVELPCRAEPQLFFAEDPRDVLRAKALCYGCPVRLACLADALRRREPCGVWGGELLDRGAVIASKRARGRPRKAGSVRRDPAA
jgi:WhiB family redox-sensing transcriptional regulator